MTYLTRNQTKQNVLSVIAGMIILTASVAISVASGGAIADSSTAAFVSVFLYFFLMLISGMLVGSISFQKDGYKILSVLVPLAILGSFIFIILRFYAPVSSPNAIDMMTALSLMQLGPGAILAFVGCFLGVYIKYKVQRGANFSLHFVEWTKKE